MGTAFGEAGVKTGARGGGYKFPQLLRVCQKSSGPLPGKRGSAEQGRAGIGSLHGSVGGSTGAFVTQKRKLLEG